MPAILFAHVSMHAKGTGGTGTSVGGRHRGSPRIWPTLFLDLGGTQQSQLQEEICGYPRMWTNMRGLHVPQGGNNQTPGDESGSG